jgi:hypothetical protein
MTAMTASAELPVRRRPDGSIDTDFYGRRAQNLRRTAIRNWPRRWLCRLRHWQQGWREHGSAPTPPN